MSFYFRSVPDFEYSSPIKDAPITDYVQVKNLFKKSRIREDIFGSLVYFTKYNIVGDERPDQLAERFYEDPSLDWVILLSNNIQDVRSEWPLDNRTFDETLLDKYGSYENLYSLHHYETVEIKNSQGVTILPAGIKLSTPWKTNGNFLEVDCQKITQIFSGNGVIPTNQITVTLNTGVKGLKVDDEVTIQNVSDASFNGRFRVTSVFIPFNDGITRGFTYQIPSVPSASQPTLTSQEQVLLVVYDGGANSGNVYFFEYQDQESLIRLPSTSILSEVTNYDYELNLNNKKREIYILKSTYLGIILRDAETSSSYKTGGSQYITDKLKRADNPKIYS